MRKLNFCIVVIFLLIQINLYSQQIDKVIISGLGGSHDSNVKTAFQIGYTSYNSIPFPGEIILLQNNIQESFDYAIGNDFDLIIRSTTGLSTGIRLAPNYPTVRLVMPAGSNDHIQTFFGDVVSSPVVITGAGIDSNQTAYKLEFFSIDPITGTNLSSYANGYIAGQIAFISNTLDVSFDSARTLARIYGSENGELDFRNGFGKIPVSKIINEALPVELISFTGKIIGSKLNTLGLDVSDYIIVPDEIETLQNTLLQFCAAQKDLVIITGGTGLSPRDTTPEAIIPLLDRRIPGIEEAVRSYGQDRTPYAMLSRSVVGFKGDTLIMALPGSTSGASESIDAVFPSVLHLFKIIKGFNHDKK